jgi:hypothetical protein
MGVVAAIKPVKLVEGVDYYWEGELMVFTAHYLLRRGNCCNSGCRHCPFRDPLGAEVRITIKGIGGGDDGSGA